LRQKKYPEAIALIDKLE